MVGDPGIEPGVSRLEGVTVPCHTLRPVAHCGGDYLCPYAPSTAKVTDFTPSLHRVHFVGYRPFETSQNWKIRDEKAKVGDCERAGQARCRK